MIRSSRNLWFLTTLVASCAYAGPLDRSIVHPDATWLVHVDMEAGMAGVLGTHLTERMAKDPHNPLSRMKRDFGLDPTHDVRGVTVFGLPGQIDDGIAIITTTSAADTMGERLAQTSCKGLTTTKRENSVVYTWELKGRTFRAAVYPGRRVQDRLVVLADSERVLEQGIQAVERDPKQPVAAPSPMPQAEPRPGSIIFATAADLNREGEPRPQASILQAAKTLVIDAGQLPGDTEVYGSATIVAADKEEAVKVQHMAQGVLALLATGAADRPEEQPVVADVVKGVKITTDGDRCIVESHHTATVVAAMLDLLAERRMRAHREAIEQYRKDHPGEERRGPTRGTSPTVPANNPKPVSPTTPR